MDQQLQPGRGAISLNAYFRLLRANANFRRLWMAQIVSEVGDWFYVLAIYSLLLELTGKASSVALALVLQVLPQTLVGPASGVINDRVRRKRVMIVADLARMVIVSAMLLVRSRQMVWLIYPLLLLETIMAAFFEPARTSIIPNICAREDVILANTLSSTTWSLNLAMGAAIGGAVAALLGRDAVFVLNGLSFLVSAIFLSRMRLDEPHAERMGPLRARELFDFTPLMDGWRYVRSDQRLMVTLFVKAGMLIIGPSWILFTVMGQRYFPVRLHGLDPQRGAILGMSILMGSRGIGALIGPLVSAPWAGRRESRLRMGILLGFLAEAFGYALLGIAPGLTLACISVVIAHIGGSVIWVFSTTLLQLNTDDRFRGRVFATELGLFMLTIAVGAYAAGHLMDRGISPRWVAGGTGLLMLIPGMAWAVAMRLWKDTPAAIAVGSEADPGTYAG
jgi:MFS family permease